jgi:dUTP pyrophosphatase
MEYGKAYGEKVAKEMEYQFNSPYKIKEPFFENWHLRKDDNCGINEIDTYISELNSQDNFIAEINSLPMPESYPHEDDRFNIPEEYKNMTKEELEDEKEKLLKELLKGRKQNMNERIAQFEKVSKEQFTKDMIDKFPILDEAFVGIAYENFVQLPIRKTSGSAGYDFVTPVNIEIEPNKTFTVPTGIRCNMRNDFVLNIYVRSSIGFKYQTVLANGTGIIDSDYYNAENEGHIMIKLINHSDKTVKIDAGDAFAQGIFLQYGITNDDMADGVRVGGIGSTGKQ